jgi:hypothetical protein
MGCELDKKQIPTGRGLAVKYEGLWILNVCAPSGAGKKVERETFFNSGLNYILPTTTGETTIAGDFNCIVHAVESTSPMNYSRALQAMIRGLGLKDAWEPRHAGPGYTHFTARSASRLDRIYLTANTLIKKRV